MTRILASLQGFMVGALVGLLVGATLGSTDALLVRPDEVAAAELRGLATWYDYRPGHAAAGPELRAALGSDWRGTTVRVAAGTSSTVVVLSDWCACPGGRVVDLDRRSFAVLADPAVGVLRVTVTWPATLPALPDTSTEGTP
jgi:rare lipoprotein A (peptidoglycan hydrolase)